MSHPAPGPRVCVVCGAGFTAGATAKYCDVCRPLQRRAKQPTYVWTAERDELLRQRYDGSVRRRAQELASELGFPPWTVKRRAAELGLARPWPTTRRDWTEEELAFLAQWSGHREPLWIARRLKRTLASVVVQQRRSALCRRVRAGYTLRDLCRCFGVDGHVVRRWAQRGQLRIARRETARLSVQGGDPWSVAEADVVAFVRANPDEIDLRKVDQAWFFDVIVGATLKPSSVAEMGRPDDVAAVRAVVAELEEDETASTQEIHARVSVPAAAVRLALRSLQASGEVVRVWRRGVPEAARRSA